MEILKTKDYDLFKFRDDNRERINQSHVKRIAESIKSRNLLEFRPISVNAKMEVIDGQHRLLAAKLLDVEIYYSINKELQHHDIIILNTAQVWGQQDYLNYYCKNGYAEYIKMKEFMKKHNLTIKIALNITSGNSKEIFNNFKNGTYKFNDEEFNQNVDICWQTIDYIKKMNGYSQYVMSARFWSALLTLVRNEDFNAQKWMESLKRSVDRFSVRAKKEDYLKLFMDTYNWRNNNKIELI